MGLGLVSENSYTRISELWSYNTTTGIWKKCPNLPVNIEATIMYYFVKGNKLNIGFRTSNPVNRWTLDLSKLE